MGRKVSIKEYLVNYFEINFLTFLKNSQPRKIPDPNAKKPVDWLENESELIPDSTAKKPENWDIEIDGEWEPPLINNPKCAKVSGCGKCKFFKNLTGYKVTY